MEIKRIDTYQDSRFSQKVLCQHGCFLADGIPYEVEIISDSEAVIRGADPSVYSTVIDTFRFYTPHITCFYDKSGGGSQNISTRADFFSHAGADSTIPILCG